MPPENNEQNRKDRIEELKKSLYSNQFKEQDIVHGVHAQEGGTVQESWGDERSAEDIHRENAEISFREKKMSLKKIFIGSLIFFVIAAAFAAIKIFTGNVFSADQVEISVSGPVSVVGGDTFDLGINITNLNDTDIESADLVVEYPPGAYKEADSQQALTRDRITVGAIGSKETVNEHISAVLFGEQNSSKEIRFVLEFRFKGSSATLQKEELYQMQISSSPIDLSLNILNEVTSGQDMTFLIDVGSNSEKVLEGLLAQADYPFGFTFESASPAPTYGNNVWDIGDLAPGSHRTIRVTGKMEGQQGEEKTFNAHIGNKSSQNSHIIGTAYNSVLEQVKIAQPFLALDLVIDGDRSNEYVFGAEKPIRADVLWKSTLPTKIIDGKIEVKLNGKVLDEYSVNAGAEGFYRSVDNTLVWDKNSTPELSVIEPGAKGQVSFSFTSLPLYSETGDLLKNPNIVLEVSAKGKRISDTNVPEEIKTSIKKTIKIESDMRIVPRVVYYEGPYVNSGPLPPRAEQETTYTVIWTVTNSSNTIKDAKVRTTLPTYVNWLGAPGQSENVSFNDVGGEVVWDLGTVAAGAGITSPAREVAFQIVLLPSVSQVGKTPSLTGDIVLTGEDTYTGSLIKRVSLPLTTKLSTDPNVYTTNGFVQP